MQRWLRHCRLPRVWGARWHQTCPLPSSFNQFTRHDHDDLNCFLVGEARAAQAVQVSQLYGNSDRGVYSGPSAAALVAAGAAKFKTLNGSGQRAR